MLQETHNEEFQSMQCGVRQVHAQTLTVADRLFFADDLEGVLLAGARRSTVVADAASC
jgi:hypothetical protein